MNTTDALIALAQFSMTLAGFIGALVAFVARNGRWHAADAFRTRRALATSLGVGFLAMVPIALQLAGIAGDALWRTASALAACHGVLWMAADARRYWRERAEIRDVVPGWGAVVVYASGAGIAVVHALNGAGAWSAPRPGVYFAAQLYALLLPAAVFTRIPFVRPVCDATAESRVARRARARSASGDPRPHAVVGAARVQ